MFDGATLVGFRAVVAGASSWLGHHAWWRQVFRCVKGVVCLVSEVSSLRFVWTGCNVQVAFCIYFGALI